MGQRERRATRRGPAFEWTEREPFRALARRGSGVFAVAGDDLILTWVNPVAGRSIGRSPRALVGTSALDLVHDDDHGPVLAALRDTPVGEQSAPVALRSVGPDGSWRNVEIVLTNLVDDPEVGGVVINARDIREPQIGEEPGTDDPFRLFASSAPIGILFLDSNGNATYVNERWLEITGMRPEDARGWCWLEATHPDDRDWVLESAMSAATLDGGSDIVQRVLRPDGVTVWIRSRSASVRGPDGAAYGHTVSVEDITSEVEARESTERLVQTLEATSDFVVIVDADGRLLYANPGARAVLGVDDISGLDSGVFERHLSAETFERFESEERPALRRDGAWQGEFTVNGDDGGEIPVHLSVRAHHDEGGDLKFVSAIGRDISERKVFERKLAASEARFRALVQHSYDLVSVWGRSGQCTYASPSHASVLGYPADLHPGGSTFDLLHPDDAPAAMKRFADAVEGEPIGPFVYRLRHADGSWRSVESVATRLFDDPDVRGLVVNSRDVTARHRAEHLATEQAEVLERAARGAPLDELLGDVASLVERWIEGGSTLIAVLGVDGATMRVAAAPSMPGACVEAYDGYVVHPQERRNSPDDLFFDAIRDDIGEPGVGRMLIEHGFQAYWVRVVRHSVTGVVLGSVLVHRRDHKTPEPHDLQLLDLAANVAAISIERAQSEARLAFQAIHDPLTGLPNRAQVLDRLREVVDEASDRNDVSAVFFLDVDRFKVLNDSLGHDAGDQLLVEFGARLLTDRRPGDIVARFGGDEFVIVCRNLPGQDAAHAVGRRLLELVQEPFEIDRSQVVVTASIGMAIVDGNDASALLRDADAAMYVAKDRGRNRLEVFDGSLRARAVDRLDTERELRHALAAGELTMHYQPGVRLTDGRVIGFEALLRWNHPERGLLYPAEFLPVAEETGLIADIGLWGLEEACGQLAAWNDRHPEWGRLVISVNLSARQLADRDLAVKVAAIAERTGVDPSTLAVEITESVLVDDPPLAIGTLRELRNLGLTLALDDFGTGYSSLLHLKRFPIQVLKIDRSFVNEIDVDEEDAAIVESVVMLARTLGLIVVAEGVERTEQAEHLLEIGCGLGQGFWWSPALPADEIEARLAGQISPLRLNGSAPVPA